MKPQILHDDVLKTFFEKKIICYHVPMYNHNLSLICNFHHKTNNY